MTAENDIRAAEYVLGTLSAEERNAFETSIKNDASVRQAVEFWQKHFSPLGLALKDVEPPAHVWQSIEAALPAPPAASSLLLLRRSRNRWRAGALLLGTLAAGIAVLSFRQVLISQNEMAGSYIAVVNRSGDEPALIIRVDLATRTIFIRPVATNVPQGHSLELWYIGSHMPPKSMGLVDKANRRLPVPENARIEKANFAVTVEPQGGSPTGAPTGPIVYSGQLFKE